MKRTTGIPEPRITVVVTLDVDCVVGISALLQAASEGCNEDSVKILGFLLLRRQSDF